MKVPSTRGLARWSARRPWRVVALWVLLIVLAVVASGALPSPITSDQGFTNAPESVKGQDLIEQRLRGAQPATETVESPWKKVGVGTVFEFESQMKMLMSLWTEWQTGTRGRR